MRVRAEALEGAISFKNQVGGEISSGPLAL